MSTSSTSGVISSIPISSIPISSPPSIGDGGNSGDGTAGGAAGGAIGASAAGAGAGFGVFNVNFFCSPYKETPSSFSLSLFNSPAKRFNLLKA